MVHHVSGGAVTVNSVSRRQVYRLPREKRVADIMEAARIVFSEKGYNDSAISEIAERVGVVEGTIYRYFVSKRDLLIKVVEHWYEEILTDYDQQLKGIHGTWNRLRFMVWGHLTVIHDEPALCRLLFTELRSGPEYRDSAVFELTRAYTQKTLDIVQDAMASGELREDVSLRIVRDMIYGGVEHHAWGFLRGERDFSPDTAADSITDIIYRGLAKDAVSASNPAEPTLRRLEEVADRLERLVETDLNRPSTPGKI